MVAATSGGELTVPLGMLWKLYAAADHSVGLHALPICLFAGPWPNEGLLLMCNSYWTGLT